MTIPINGEVLWTRLMKMATLGATPAGGVNRQAFSPADHDAYRLLNSWAQEAGFSTGYDPIGNLFIRREGRDRLATPVVLGSHLDTQPTGGRFDGALGVVAAFEVLQAFERVGYDCLRPLVCVAWRNEEGSRFQPSCMGSRLFAGELDLAACLKEVDPFGVSVEKALAAGEIEPTLPLGFPISAYLELHIEQGPELERRKIPVGAVTSIQGRHRYEVTVRGTEAHAGTTPVAHRKDALKTAAALINRLYGEFETRDDHIRFTVGALDVFPNSPNTIPGTAQFLIDLRHPEDDVLTEIGNAIGQVGRDHEGPCVVNVRTISRVHPTVFPEAMVDLVAHHAEKLGYRHLRMASGAGHDAAACAPLASAGMVFIPCRDGLSHNEAEWTNPEHVAAGTEVLAACAADLAALST